MLVNFFLILFLFLFLFLFIYLFMAVLGLRFCARAFPSYGEWGLLLIVVYALLIVVASCGAQALGTWAQ